MERNILKSLKILIVCSIVIINANNFLKKQDRIGSNPRIKYLIKRVNEIRQNVIVNNFLLFTGLGFGYGFFTPNISIGSIFSYFNNNKYIFHKQSKLNTIEGVIMLCGMHTKILNDNKGIEYYSNLLLEERRVFKELNKYDKVYIRIYKIYININSTNNKIERRYVLIKSIPKTYNTNASLCQ